MIMAQKRFTRHVSIQSIIYTAKPNFIFSLAIILLAQNLTPTDSFAAWFVENESACWTPLEAGEVIMNADVLPASSSRFPEIGMKVFDHINKINLHEGKITDSVTIPFNDEDKFRLSLTYPKGAPLADVQFVMETSEGASFIDASGSGGFGCDGKRGFGRSNDEVLLEMKNQEIDGNEFQESVRVWAGWAMGHESVTLTPRIKFQYKNMKNEENYDTGLNREKDEIHHHQRLDPEINELPAQHKVAMEKLQNMHDSILLRNDHEKIKNMQMGNIVNDAKPPLGDYGFNNEHENVQSRKVDRLNSRMKNKRVHDKFYSHEHANSLSFSIPKFYVGCLFIVFFFGVILSYANKSKKKNKGRRDL